jgi:hypothetical protein
LSESSRQSAISLGETNTAIAQLTTVAHGLQKEISRFKVQTNNAPDSSAMANVSI